MSRQKNMFQNKGQDKTTAKKLNEMQSAFIKIVQSNGHKDTRLEKIVDELGENFNKELGNIEKEQSELRNKFI